MVLWTSFLPLLGSVFVTAAAAQETTADVVPGAYIVELDDSQDSTAFYNDLGDTEGPVEHRLELNYSLFKGTSFRLKNASHDVDAAAKRIAKMATVKQMWPVHVLRAPKVEVVWQGSDQDVAKPALQKRQSTNDSDTSSTHVMTQVDKLRAEGVTGQGVKVAVIDSGIDYNHPALGGCFGSGCLVAYGADLVGDDYDGTNTPVPDFDPFDACNGHGTHVAGVIAAQKNPLGFTGAAPGVTLGAYRAYGCANRAGTDVLIAAFNQAYEDGSDIITCSIGSLSGWSEQPWAVAAQRIVEAGVPCTVSAGNAGSQGIFSAGTASSGKGVTAIGSVDNTQTLKILSNGTLTSENNTASGGFASSLTSWGPTWELDVKPQFAAPGGSILSTYPLAQGGYAVLSGTSQACPFAAAVYALIANVRGTLDPATIQNLLSATSNPNLFNLRGISTLPYLAPVAQQGGGLIQAYDAAYATTLLSVSSLVFNDTDHFVETTNFTIQNLGTEDVTYSLSNVVAATAYTLGDPVIFPSELVEGSTSLAFSDEKVTVPAGGSAIVTVSPTAPTDLDASRLPVYSGYIALNGTNGDSLSLPYLGVLGSMHDATVLDTANTYLVKSNESNSRQSIPANEIFILPGGNGTASDGTVYPAIVTSLVLGSARIRADVVPQNPQANNATTVLGVRTLGNIFGFPDLYKSRGRRVAEWNGMLEDGSYAPEGSYTLLVRALKIFGDRGVEEEYDTKETVPFTISYQ
ncbi:subtilisin-like protein [Decorospora gaudefroyi]|uniref:Subtilisin-like protein n=1 Tax=Decorospora gaudefroyi TaxID=184978 RepID=A0A6A5JYD1_9PLEO|nr:subtilisin-like protein [Decorospora gaudefroyi]